MLSIVLRDKVQRSREFVLSVMQTYATPVLLWSSGKDSMVLLHILRSLNIHMPLILYRNPFFPHKYVFADRIIRDWRLTVFDYPPFATGLKMKNGHVEVVMLHQIGLTRLNHLPTNMAPIEDAWDWRCGLEVLARPTGTVNLPWTVLLIGHKSCDTDPTEGDLTLHTQLQRNHPHAPDLAFPLKDWTHEEVWAYTEEFAVPVQTDRYAKINGQWQELEDKTANPDHTPICIRCVDKRLSGMVDCPLLHRPIPNVSEQMTYLPDHGLTYFGTPKDLVAA